MAGTEKMNDLRAECADSWMYIYYPVIKEIVVFGKDVLS